MASKDKELYEKKLRSGGVTFSGEYLGSVPVMKPVKDMLRAFTLQVIAECIKLVSARHGMILNHQVNSIVEAVIGEPSVDRCPIEMNISTKMIKIIKEGSLFQRHPITYLSYAARGQENEISYVVGYIGKNTKGSDRRCHIISVDDADQLMQVMEDAIHLAAQGQNITQDGFAVPSSVNLPARGAFPRHHDNVTPRQQNDQSSIIAKEMRVAADMSQANYYHGTMTREQVVKLLKNEGDFVIRKSEAQPGQYIMSGCYQEGHHTHILLLDDDKNVSTGNQQFESISELVRFYMESGKKVESMDKKTTLPLLTPIPRTL